MISPAGHCRKRICLRRSFRFFHRKFFEPVAAGMRLLSCPWFRSPLPEDRFFKDFQMRSESRNQPACAGIPCVTGIFVCVALLPAVHVPARSSLPYGISMQMAPTFHNGLVLTNWMRKSVEKQDRKDDQNHICKRIPADISASSRFVDLLSHSIVTCLLCCLHENTSSAVWFADSASCLPCTLLLS